MNLVDLSAGVSFSTGTGNFTVSPVPGRQSLFVSYPDEELFPYYISNSLSQDLEAGIGYMQDATTLIRENVFFSSNANSIVDFPVGTKTVASDMPAFMQFLLYKPPRVITAAGPGAVLNTDRKIEINQTVGAPFILNFNPATLLPGQEFIVVDGKRDASTNNISLVLESGIWQANGTNTYVMNNNGESLMAYCDGTNGRII